MSEDQDRKKYDFQGDEGYIPPRNQQQFRSAGDYPGQTQPHGHHFQHTPSHFQHPAYGQQPGLDGDEHNYGFFQDQQRAAEAGFQQPPFGRFPVLNPRCQCPCATHHQEWYTNTATRYPSARPYYTAPYENPDPRITLSTECMDTIKNAVPAGEASRDAYLLAIKEYCRDGIPAGGPVRELQAKLWLATVDKPDCCYLYEHSWTGRSGVMALNHLGMFANSASELTELAKTTLLALFTFLELNDDSIGLDKVLTYFKVSKLDRMRFL